MYDTNESSVAQIRHALKNRETTSAELVLAYMKRIAEIDKDGPKLNSVLELNPDAVFIAEAMDRERAAGRVRGPMHGIPVLIKDNISTADKMRTSAGSLALADNYAPYDAEIVRRMREAGMVIMGKTNMTEFANFMAHNMRSGYSSRGGQVLNPYKADGEVSGSSSGSAVAAAASLCAVTVGTETNGSIMSPAHRNCVVGIKPTVGLVSRRGIIPISVTQDTAGPLCRTVADAAELLNVLAGPDDGDPATVGVTPDTDYTRYLDDDGLRGMRVGLDRAWMGDLNDEQRAIAEASFKAVRDAGAVAVDGADLPHARCSYSNMLYEFRACLNAYLAEMRPSIACRSLADIIRYCTEHQKECLEYGMGRLLDSEYGASGTLTDPKYIRDHIDAIRISRTDGIDKVMDEHELDVLMCPGVTDSAAVAGYPSILVPAGFTSDGMPYGMMFIGRAYSEPTLIRAAHSFELRTKARRAPRV